jgi:prophage regulatory protein
MKFLRIRDVIAKTGLPKASVYCAISKGEFPTQLQLSDRCVAWDEDEVEAWMKNCLAVRDANLTR